MDTTKPNEIKQYKRATRMGQAVILATFLCVICLYALWGRIFLPVLDTRNHENRELAQKPSFDMDTIETYPGDFEAYFGDQLPFRNELVAIHNMLDFYLFHETTTGAAVRGKKNWLFYDSLERGDPIGSYRGTNMFDEELLQAIAQRIIEMDAYMKSLDKEFVFLIIPNKERVMYEYMPDIYGEPADNYPAKQLIDYLNANSNVRVVYAYEDLLDIKQAAIEQNAGDIWYRNDTHWNYLGAYAGATALLNELGITMPSLSSGTLRVTLGENGRGDLANMAGLGRILNHDDPQNTVSGYDSHQMKKEVFDNDTVIHMKAQDADSRKLYIYRDSFGEQMAEYIGSQFNESHMCNWLSYTPEDYMEQDPDIFVYECAERFVDQIPGFKGFLPQQ